MIAKPHGKMRKKTGTEPQSIVQRGRLSIPVRTEVGQSGPPTNTAILPQLKPGALKMARTAFMLGVCTPTNFFTAMLFERGWPIAFLSSIQDNTNKNNYTSV